MGLFKRESPRGLRSPKRLKAMIRYSLKHKSLGFYLASICWWRMTVFLLAAYLAIWVPPPANVTPWLSVTAKALFAILMLLYLIDSVSDAKSSWGRRHAKG